MSTPSQYLTYGKLASGLGSAFGNPYMGDAGSALGVLGGIQQGSVSGYGRAASGAGRLAGNVLGNSNLNAGAGDLNNLLDIYQGINQGGWKGYGSATGNAAQLAGNFLGDSALSTLGGAIAAPISLYNTVQNWRSGATGSDALSGAETGAEIGSIIPGIGTVIGGLVGGAAGALSSAFGPGAKDPETAGVQGLINYTSSHGNGPSAAQNDPNPYLGLAGLMDERSSTLPVYQQYGRMGEQKFTGDLANQINEAFTPGKGIQSGIFKGDVWSKNANGDYVLTTPTGGTATYSPDQAAAQVYNSAVSPWVSGMGSGWNKVGQTYNTVGQGLLQDMTGQYLSGQAANDWKAVGGDSPFANIYAGSPFQGAQPPAQPIPVAPSTSHIPHQLAAEGGSMKKRKKSALQELYEGPSFSERHFDDGGSNAYVDYTAPATPFYDPNYNYGSTISSQYPAVTDETTPGLQQLSYNPSDPTSSDFIYNYTGDPNSSSYLGGSGGGSGTGAISGLQSLTSQHPWMQGLAALPLLAGAFGLGQGKQASAPSSLPGFSSGVAGSNVNPTTGALNIPSFQRTQTQVNPNTDWYTYGQHPEAQFFQNNQLPTAAGISPNYTPSSGASLPQPPSGMMTTQPVNLSGRPVMARGGALGQAFDSDTGDDYVPDPGHGDGTSDAIPAKLSGGEYVVDAGTVSMLGNGSNEAGARALDQLRQRVRKHAGKKLVKGQQFMKAREPQAYLPKKVGT